MSEASTNSPNKSIVSSARTEVTEFKKPVNAVKKKKPKILTEEKYIEELSKIIQRDFFPDLEKLRAQNDYLDAMERKDYAQMEAIRAKYTAGSRPTSQRLDLSPASFETPSISVNGTPRLPKPSALDDTPKSTMSFSSTVSQSKSGKSLADKHSLDSFLTNYTSEDNYSFQEIVDAAEEKLQQKFLLLYNHENLSAETLARALTLPSIETQFAEPDPAKMIETWTYKNKNSIMYIPDGVDLTEEEKIENASRKQIIQHSATRLHCNPFDEKRSQEAVSEIAKQQTQALIEKIGVDGNKVVASNDLCAPQIRGFDLIKTPTPRPGEDFSPLMTWGEIEGTPFRLDGSDTPLRPNAGPSFKMPENSRRENIALALAEKVGVKMRAQKQRAMDTARKNIGSPYIRSNVDRFASMSPAARRLATTKLGLRLPSSMTPSPHLHTPNLRVKGKSISSTSKTASSNDSMIRKTPNSSRGPSTPYTPKTTLTDDLLQIPNAKAKRPSAADFF